MISEGCIINLLVIGIYEICDENLVIMNSNNFIVCMLYVVFNLFLRNKFIYKIRYIVYDLK